MSVDQQPINRLPSQLLKLLGLSGPDAPNRMSATVIPVAELLPWWALSAEQSFVLPTNVPIAAVGPHFGGGSQVPAGANWVITSMGLRLGTPAATNVLQVQGAILDPAGNLYPIGPVSNTWTNAGKGAIDCFQAGRASWLHVPSGWNIGFNVETNTSTAIASILLTARILQYPA